MIFLHSTHYIPLTIDRTINCTLIVRFVLFRNQRMQFEPVLSVRGLHWRNQQLHVFLPGWIPTWSLQSAKMLEYVLLQSWLSKLYSSVIIIVAVLWSSTSHVTMSEFVPNLKWDFVCLFESEYNRCQMDEITGLCRANNGTCIDDVDTYKCICPHDRTGYNCELGILYNVIRHVLLAGPKHASEFISVGVLLVIYFAPLCAGIHWILGQQGITQQKGNSVGKHGPGVHYRFRSAFGFSLFG